ncbi:MAG TPA: hypothetical protein VGL40_12510 [Bacillota bacterium]|jgi:hypothetical protein
MVEILPWMLCRGKGEWALPFFGPTSGPGAFVVHFRQDPIRDFGVFAKAYGLAASNLAQALLARANWPDHDAYPVVFLYRHSFELHLKNVISKGSRLATYRDETGIHQRMVYSHDLDELMSVSRAMLHAAFPDDAGLSSVLTDIDAIAREFVEIDASSLTFRYPTDRKGESPGPALRLGLDRITRTMDTALEALDAIDFGLDLETDRAKELRGILESFLSR